jgi:hypothetical protein
MCANEWQREFETDFIGPSGQGDNKDGGKTLVGLYFLIC